MSTLFLIIGGAFVLSVLPLSLLAVCKYLSYRRGRSVVCPGDFSVATIRVKAAHAAWTSLTGEPDLQLASCSRTPRRTDCNESCLVQFDAADDRSPVALEDRAAQVSRLPG
jgi:hypothetical protein